MNNPLTTTIAITVRHEPGLKLKPMLTRIARTIKLQSNRSVVVTCGDDRVFLWGNDKAI